MRITRIEMRHTDAIVFFDVLLKRTAVKSYLDYEPYKIYTDRAEGYSAIFDVPRGSLFLCIEDAEDELKAMSIALETINTPEFQKYYNKNKA